VAYGDERLDELLDVLARNLVTVRFDYASRTALFERGFVFFAVAMFCVSFERREKRRRGGLVMAISPTAARNQRDPAPTTRSPKGWLRWGMTAARLQAPAPLSGSCRPRSSVALSQRENGRKWSVRLSLRLTTIRLSMRAVERISMKRLALLVVPALVSACGVQLRAAVPPPPVVTVDVAAQPPPPEPAAPAPPAAEASFTVDVEPVSTGDPEEVTATSEPPDPVYEEQTVSTGPGYVWIGGYWGWNGVDWGWNWGRWEPAPEGGVIYIEPYYERVGDHVVYVRGYWGPHDAPRRSYGGDRIQMRAAARPANYHRGDHPVVEHRAGPAPGKRPGGAYVKATGTVRPLPKATAPAHRVASTHETATPRSEPNKEAPNAHGAATTHEATTAHEGVTPAHEGATQHEVNSHESTTAREPTPAPREAPKKDESTEKAAHATPIPAHTAPPPTQPKKPTPAPPKKKEK
jgi:hypothetical protein